LVAWFDRRHACRDAGGLGDDVSLERGFRRRLEDDRAARGERIGQLVQHDSVGAGEAHKSAHLQGPGAGDFRSSRAQMIGHALEQGNSLRRPHAAPRPGIECGPCRRDGGIHVLRVGLRDRADHPFGVGRDELDHAAGMSGHPSAVDPELVRVLHVDAVGGHRFSCLHCLPVTG
jgi:hypothetical protein